MITWIVICATLIVPLLFFTITNLCNMRGLRRIDGNRVPPGDHLVSIVVPARNEEANIERCVRSLLGQTGVPFEVIVVDDNSTDATRDILLRLAAVDPRLTVVDGVPLPRGWMGKNWACWQGFRASRGDAVLFTDADTRHEPYGVSGALERLLSTDSGLLSMLVSQETGTLGVKLFVPVLFWLACSVFPFALMNEDSRLPLHFGNGQFMLFRREAYLAIGGHKAIRNNVFDDMTLARSMRDAGHRVVVVDGSRSVTCRMYENLPSAYKGLCKNLYMLVRYSLPAPAAIPAYLIGLSVFALVMFGPIASLIIDVSLILAGFPLSVPVILLGAGGVALTLLSFGIVSMRFRFPPVMVVLYPVTIVLFLAAALGSLVLTVAGKTEWKGRILRHAD